MAAVTVQGVRDFVRAFITIDTDDISDTQIDTYTQMAYDDLMGGDPHTPWFEIGGQSPNGYSITTVAGQQTYALPTVLDPVQGQPCTVDPKKIVAIQGPHWELRYAAQTEMEAAFVPSFISTQEPMRWSFWGEIGFTLWPTPNDAYVLNIRAYRDPLDFISLGAAATIDAPIKYHTAIQQKAVAIGWSQQQDLQQSSYWNNEYEGSKERLAREFRRGRVTGGIRVNRGQRPSGLLPPRLHFSFEPVFNGDGD